MKTLKAIGFVIAAVSALLPVAFLLTAFYLVIATKLGFEVSSSFFDTYLLWVVFEIPAIMLCMAAGATVYELADRRIRKGKAQRKQHEQREGHRRAEGAKLIKRVTQEERKAKLLRQMGITS